jgi:phosphoglycerate dehydrogenase-like enzyme
MKNRLLILSRDTNRYESLIKGLGPEDLEIHGLPAEGDAKALVGRCNILLGEPNRIAPHIPAAASLQWVQSTFAGVEPLLTPGSRRDYLLTGVKKVFDPYMGEYVFAYILALERHLFETLENQRNRTWRQRPYQSLADRLIGICGLGSIGRHIARTAKHFNMTVWGFKRKDQRVQDVDRVFTPRNFNGFLKGPDYMVVTLPATDNTRHLFDEAAFGQMKNSAVLINVSRGSIVSEPAVVGALEKGLIKGAVLDVFEKEPLSDKSPLWTCPNLFITPHNAGYSFPEDVVSIFAENYRRFMNRKPLLYQIDFRRGY